LKNKPYVLNLFIVLLIVSGVFFQLGLTVENSFFKNDFYRQLFKEVDLTPYARAMMYEEIEKSMPYNLPESTMEWVVDNLSNIYDRAWFEKELLVIIDDLILYLKGKKNSPPPFLLDLSEKNELTKSMIGDSLLEVKKIFPLLIIFDALLGNQGIEMVIDNIPMPQYFDLNNYFAEKDITDDIAGSVRKFKQFRGVSLYLPIVFFVICLILFIRTYRPAMALKLFSTGIIISGVIYLLTLLLRKPLFLNPMKKNMLADGIAEAPAMIHALELAFGKALHIPVFFILAGLILLLASLLLDLFMPAPEESKEYFESY
jgi:hypothetical protein